MELEEMQRFRPDLILVLRDALLPALEVTALTVD